MGDSTGRFPAPYQNDVKASDPIMKRVPMDHLGIGARASGMPKSAKMTEGSISHVGDSASGSGKK